MKNIDKTVINETKYIAVCVIILSLFMQAVFLIIGKWNYTVLLGNILGGLTGVANFFFMGLTVQNAVLKDGKDAKALMKLSQTYRTLFMALILIVGFTVTYFNRWSVLIAILFPRVAINFRTVLKK